MFKINRFVLSAVVALTCLAFGSAEGATILFQDDFQSDVAVDSVSSDDADPVIGAGDVGGNWFVAEGFGLSVQVENDLDPNSAAIDPGLNNYVRLYRNNSNGRGVPYARGWNTPDTLNQVVRLDFMAYQTSANNTLNVFMSANGVVGSNPNNQANTFANNASIGVTLPQNFSVDQWSHVRVLANMHSSATQLGIPAQTFTVSINNGAPTSSGFAVAHNDIATIQWIEPSGAEIFNFIDDVTFQVVPEPSTFLLGGIALVGMGFATRRRKK